LAVLSEALPGGILTFWMSDIEGSTALWESHRGDMVEAIQAHEATVRRLVSDLGGHLLLSQGEGDSCFAVFADPRAALDAALSAHRELATIGVDGRPLKVRIGLHAGFADLISHTYFGPEVNRTARIRAAACGGQTLISEVARQLVRDRLPAGISLYDHGKHTLKDLLEPIGLFEVLGEGQTSPIAAPRSLDVVNHNLPTFLSSFIGRRAEQDEVMGLLLHHRLVTLAGTGGLGKSRLASRVAAELADQFAEGVGYVDFGDFLGDDALGEIRRQLGVADQAHWLPRGETLLLLDTCEVAVDAITETVATLLRRCPELKVLATSREWLRIEGEVVYDVPMLSLPPEGATGELATLSDAVSLFVDRYRLRRPTEAISADAVGNIVKIVRLVDGIPLAIEQAAAQAAFRSLAEVEVDLRDHLRDLAGLERGGTRRHRTIRACLDWSLSSLTLEEQETFTQLGVFRSPWTAELAAHFIGGRMAKDRLSALVSKSLVVRFGHTEPQTYRLLDPVAEFAREQLGAHLAEMTQRLDDVVLKLVREALDRPIDEVMPDLNRLFPHALPALERLLDSDPGAALSLTYALRYYCLRGGRVLKGRSLLEAGLRRVDHHPEWLSLWNLLGAFAFTLGDFPAATSAWTKALELTDPAKEPLRAADLQHNLAGLLIEQGEFPQAHGLLEASIAQYEALGEASKLAMAHGTRTAWFYHSGDYAGCVQQGGEAFDRAEAIGLEARATLCLFLVAMAHFEMDNLDESRQMLVAGLNRWTRVPDSGDLILALILSAQHLVDERPDAAAYSLGRIDALVATESLKLSDTQLQQIEHLEAKLASSGTRRRRSAGYRSSDLEAARNLIEALTTLPPSA
jgi:predicted ATPase/class 3 adenylate cyclase